MVFFGEVLVSKKFAKFVSFPETKTLGSFFFSAQKAGVIFFWWSFSFQKVRKVRSVSGNCNPKTLRGYANRDLFSGNQTNSTNFWETKTLGLGSFFFLAQKLTYFFGRSFGSQKVRKVRFVSGNCNPKTLRGYANRVLFSGNQTNSTNFWETKTLGSFFFLLKKLAWFFFWWSFSFQKVRKVRFVSGNYNPKTLRVYANGDLFSGNQTNSTNFWEIKTLGSFFFGQKAGVSFVLAKF